MKQHLILATFCIAVCSSYSSAATRTMVVNTSASEPEMIEVSLQTRITFSDNHSKMIVTGENDADSYTFNVKDIENIVFTATSSQKLTGVDLDDIKISYVEGILTIFGPDIITYGVWNTNGTQMAIGSGNETVTLDMGDLPAGVYIVKANDKAIKFVKH